MDTNLNLETIAQRAAAECIRQHVGLNRVVTLLEAYEYVVRTGITRQTFEQADHEQTPARALGMIEALAGLVEPDNGGRFRVTPVTFASGGTAAAAADVPRLVASLVAHGTDLTADEWVREFLWIHPFADGNGRTAWILHTVFSGTLADPKPLPMFDFS